MARFFLRYENYGQTPPIELTIPGTTDWFTWFKLSPVIDNTVFFVTLSNIYRSGNKGETWQPIAGNINFPQKYFYKLYTAPNDSSTLYLNDLIDGNQSRWFKTTNANNSDPNTVTWSLFPVPKRGGDDLAVDSRNPNVLWIVHNNWRGDTAVLKFDGTSWHDLTYNLKDLHVYGLTSIVHDNLINPNGRIYAGGFRGVYYLDDGATQWTLMDGLPNVKINQLEIDYNSGKLRASTYGRGLWEAPLPNTQCNEPVVITGDSTLAAEAISYCDIHVAPGAVFTITGKLHMAPGKMITIDTAAKLVLDGGTITGIRDQMWKGIEVYGRSNKSQSPPSNQGWFKALNNAIVENAVAGVATIEGNNYTHTGGIIQANKTTFRNCTQAVAFYAFENRHPTNGSVVNNNSNFGNCTFEINNNYAGADTIRNIVSLDQVRGIDFAGCRFVNYCTSALAAKPVGIFSFNSSFLVYSLLNCNVYPCFDTIHSEFSKLGYGIRALGAATTKTFKVDDAIFTENKKNGVYASSLNYITLTRNRFYILRNDTNTMLKPFGGAYLDSCTGYIIEENIFNKSGTGSQSLKAVGLTISNSGTFNNQVYKNTFNNLDIGILAQRKNKNPANKDGLCLRCNTFNACIYDIAVTKPTNGSNTQNGIALWQGSSTDPVGNLFTGNNPNLSYNFWNIDIDNSLIPDITYYHHSNFNIYPRLKPAFGKYTNLTPSTTNKSFNPASSCPSNLNGNPGIEEKLAYDFKADSLNQILTQLVDDGNTDQLAGDVILASPVDALLLHDDLLLKSPYLSDTVMKEAIENEAVLNNALLRDVLVANPQSAKSDDLMQAVEQRWDPMPDYMVDEIMEGGEIISEKEKLEAERANYRFKSDVLYNRIIGNLLHDTLSPDASDSAYLLISQSQQLSHKYMRAVMAFEIGDTSMVAQLMDEIGGTFYPDGLLPAEHQKSLNFYNEFKSMGLLNIPVKSIDSTQAVLLMAGLANNTLPDCWVRNLLTAAGRYSFEEQYILPDELKNTDIQPERVKNINGSTIFKVFPNPANQYAVFEYSLKDGEIMASSCIQITDTQGKPYGCLSLKRPQDQVIFSTHNLKPGLYLCRLMNGGKTIKSIKLSLVR